ncbi:MAG: hypothetical protein K0S93_101 [Nitrososphaeraceae archaeon]|jgi:hypothetical protein|nr:hypothetical protein [Nitrososphaeraceae archaeon]MDF2790743.1 hypothetical protein [Neobacillus sp.]
MKCGKCNNDLKLQIDMLWEGRTSEGFYYCSNCNYRKSTGIWEHPQEELF